MLGNCISIELNKYVTVFSQDQNDPDSLINTLNGMTVRELVKQASSIVEAIKLQPEYEQLQDKPSDKFLKLMLLRIAKTCNPSTTPKELNLKTSRVGDNFIYLLSKLAPMLDDSTTCCTIRKVLNAYGPSFANAQIKSLVYAIKNDSLYRELKIELSDRTLYLFLRKSIRMTGVDMGKLRRYTYQRFARKKG